MGFLKITAQESVKSILSNQSVESNATYTCTCCIADRFKSCENIENSNTIHSGENSMENLCYHRRNVIKQVNHRRKIVQQIILFILGLCNVVPLYDGSLSFIPCGASIAWSSNFLFQHWNDYKFLSTSISWTVASLPLTAAFTSLIIFTLLYKVEIRILIISSTITMALSWLLIFLKSYHFCLLIFGRILGGAALAGVYIVIPKYLQDLSSEKCRQKIWNLMYVSFIIGVLLEYMSDYYLNDNIPQIMMFIIPIICTVGFTFYPESPHTLVRNQKYVQARNILQDFMICDEGNDNEIICKMQNWTVCEQRGDATLTVMFDSKTWVEKLVPVFGLVIFESLLGMQAILFYLKPIVIAIGEDAIDVNIQIIIICLAMLLGIFLTPIMYYKLNPKSSLLLSIVILFTAFSLLGTYYHTTNLGFSTLSDNYPYFPILCFTTIALVYTNGVVPNIHTYIHVLTVQHNRFAVQTITYATSWLITSILCAELNHVIWYIGIGWLFYNIAIISVFMLCFIILLMPRLIKDVIVIDVVNDGSEMSSSGSSERSKFSISDSTSTDIIMDNVLIV